MNRDELKEQLRAVRAMMDQMDAEQKKDYVYAGEVKTISVDGEDHKLRYYAAGGETAPAYLDIHGGGMCWGAMENADPLARMVTEQLHIHVLSLDYPLSPEAQYPEALEWLYGTVRELVRHAKEWRVDSARLIVGGRSAGGNLSAALTMLAAERKEFQFRGQILDHPWLDLCGLIGWEERVPGEGAFTKESMRALALGYAPAAWQKEPTCSPLCAPEELLRRLPPAIIQTCELDPLRPEGDRYAELLRNAGVPVVWYCFPGAAHGFSEGFDEIAKAGRQWIIDAIREQGWVS